MTTVSLNSNNNSGLDPDNFENENGETSTPTRSPSRGDSRSHAGKSKRKGENKAVSKSN